MQEEATLGLSEFLSALGSGVFWVVQNLVMAFYNFGYAVTHPGLWLDWSEKKAIMRFVYYGASVEFFFAVFAFFIVIFVIGTPMLKMMSGRVKIRCMITINTC